MTNITVKLCGVSILALIISDRNLPQKYDIYLDDILSNYCAYLLVYLGFLFTLHPKGPSQTMIFFSQIYYFFLCGGVQNQ